MSATLLLSYCLQNYHSKLSKLLPLAKWQDYGLVVLAVVSVKATATVVVLVPKEVSVGGGLVVGVVEAVVGLWVLSAVLVEVVEEG